MKTVYRQSAVVALLLLSIVTAMAEPFQLKVEEELCPILPAEMQDKSKAPTAPASLPRFRQILKNAQQRILAPRNQEQRSLVPPRPSAPFFRFEEAKNQVQAQAGAYFNAVAQQPCVYAVMCGGAVVYVGREHGDCRARLREHHNTVTAVWEAMSIPAGFAPGPGHPQATGYVNRQVGCHDVCIAKCGWGLAYYADLCPGCIPANVDNRESTAIAANAAAGKAWPWCNAKGGSAGAAGGVWAGWAQVFP